MLKYKRGINMKLSRKSRMKRMRKTCLNCCGVSAKIVRFCSDTDCPHWHLRFGKFPKSYINESGKKSAQLFDVENPKKECDIPI